jgi:biopolymer transport protein ExbB
MTPHLILAQTPNPAAAAWQFFISGGIFMWPLLVCSIRALTTIILRGMALRRRNVLPLVIESEIERLVPGGSAERLSRIVQQDDSSLARIVKTALQHLRGPRAETIEVVETKARHELVVLEKGLMILEIITGIAPLLGLIGAVSGLVHVFSALGLSTGASNTQQIARGIAEALNATVFGLSIAVPTLVAFSYFSKKIEVMSVEMETLVVELIGKCYYGRVKRADGSAGQRPVSAAAPSAATTAAAARPPAA